MENPRDRINRMKRRSEKLAKLGRPQRVLPHEFQAALDLMRRARDDHGMSARQIARQVGLHQTTVSRCMRGEQVGLLRSNYEKIMGLVFEPPLPHEDHHRSGSHVSCYGTARRFQALARKGFTYPVMGEFYGTTKQGIAKLIDNERGYVYAATALAVAEMYDKVVDTEPEDYGISPVSIKRAKLSAERNGWAPPECWDDDTIDDPDGIPQWTGECGTKEGYVSHLIYDIPRCKPCNKAMGPLGPGVKRTAGVMISRFYRFNPEALAEALAEAQTTAFALEMELGLTKGIVTRWLQGKHGVGLGNALKLARHFDLSWTDLYERKD